MALLSTPAVVLSSMKLGEADKLVTFYTRERGKISGVASGARRVKNRFGAALEPFTHCGVILFETGGDRLARIRQADVVDPFGALLKNWERLRLAAEMCGLVKRMTPERDPNAATYRLLLDGLTRLAQGDDPPLSNIIFTIRLTTHCGYQPRWDRCMRCHAKLSGARTSFSASDGGCICSRCTPSHAARTLPAVSPGTRAYVQQLARMGYALAHRLKPSPLIKREVTLLFQNHIAFAVGLPPRGTK